MPDQSTSVVLMSEAEARAAIKTIREQVENSLSSFDRALTLVAKFDESEGWRVLGYRSLGACLAFELQVTRSRAYDILDKVRASALLTEEKEPSRDDARRALGKASATKTVAPATESDQLIEDEPVQATLERDASITREHFSGGTADSGFDYDEGAALYQCRHCQRRGSIEDLFSHCLILLRGDADSF